jgi:hypothetical protein
MCYPLYILQIQSTNRYHIGQTQDIQKPLTYHNANYSKALKNDHRAGVKFSSNAAW